MKRKTKIPPQHRQSKRLRLAHHRHSGRQLPHGMTSYPALALMLLVTGAVMLTAAVSARAATVTQTGNIAVSAIVPGPPPTIPAVITSPVNDQQFQATPIVVSGTCAPDLLVRVYKNSLLAGSTYCTNLGQFTLNIDLLLGRNDLTAKNFDTLDQPGPDSPTVVVYYAPPVSPVTGGGVSTGQSVVPAPGRGVAPTRPSEQVLLSTDYLFRGIKPNVEFSWDLAVSGGQAPYAISIDWGDGQTALSSVADAGKLRLQHTYTRPGRYKIVIRGSDLAGHTAYLELAAVVDGVVPTLVGPIDSSTSQGQFYTRALALLPVYLALIALVLAFWLGEKYGLSLTKRGRPFQKA